MAIVTMQLPSLVIDGVAEDVLGATQPEIASGAAGPFTLADGDTLMISTDTGGGCIVTFNAADFTDVVGGAITTTAEELAPIINAEFTLAGLDALAFSDADGYLVIRSNTYGPLAWVTVDFAPAAFDFDTGVQVDGTDVTTTNVVLNTLPEADEIEVSPTSTIQFSVFDASGTAPALADITAYVNGVIALTGGTFQTGYGGGASGSALVDAATRRVTIDPTFAFDSQDLVSIRVVCGDADETWAFTIEDTTAPELSDVSARDVSTLRVTFSEAVVMGAGSANDDALNPENYTLARNSTFAAEAEVVAVTQVSATSVDLTTSVPLTFGAAYTLTAAATIEDVLGNAMAPAPNNAVTFTAYNPAVPDGRRFWLWDWIPSVNKRQDSTRDLYKFVHVLQELTNVLLYEIDRMAEIIDPDIAPEAFVDAMLTDLGNPFALDLSLADKRRLLGVLVPIYKLKGTEQGIVRAVQFFLGLVITVTSATNEGFALGLNELGHDSYLGPGTSYQRFSFSITSPVALTAEQRDRITEIANYMKPAHTHLARLIEPATPVEEIAVDHAELGLSRLGADFLLH